MAKYRAEISCMSILTIEFECDGIPTVDDALDAASYVENHVDTWTSEEVVDSIVSLDENDEEGTYNYALSDQE